MRWIIQIHIYIYNSSDEKMSEAATGGVLVWKSALRNFEKFTEEHLCQSLYFNKVPGLCPATLLKKRLWHRCFPLNFTKFLRTPFLQNISGRLSLKCQQSVSSEDAQMMHLTKRSSPNFASNILNLYII